MAVVQKVNNYGDDAIQQLTPREHVRRRTGMYVGTPGDGSEREDALYVLVKEVIDNGIDEFNEDYNVEYLESPEYPEASVRRYPSPYGHYL